MTASSISSDRPHAIDRPRERTLVKLWLWLVAALVFAMVVVGGATRLTGSGLSITEWNPIMGAIPPLTHEAWEAAFAKYREIPQFRIANPDMTLTGFQFIFWWEWSHRFLGRFIGVAFFVPFVAFLATGRITRAELPRFLGLFVLGGLQGLVGWWMVASGLVDRISVAPYRLAIHLTLASLIFVAIAVTAATLDRPRTNRVPSRMSASVLLVAVLIQIFLGALVAGNGAGLVYNTWPSMNGAIVPPDILAHTPLWRNFFENPATVQFIHRLGAYAVFALAIVEAWRFGRSGTPRAVTAKLLVAAAFAQAGLGIATLLMMVPLDLALAHQAGRCWSFLSRRSIGSRRGRGREPRPQRCARYSARNARATWLSHIRSHALRTLAAYRCVGHSDAAGNGEASAVSGRCLMLYDIFRRNEELCARRVGDEIDWYVEGVAAARHRPDFPPCREIFACFGRRYWGAFGAEAFEMGIFSNRHRFAVGLYC